MTEGPHRMPPRWRGRVVAGTALVLAAIVAVAIAVAGRSEPGKPVDGALPVPPPALVAHLSDATPLDRRCAVVLSDPAELRPAARPLARQLAEADVAPFGQDAAEQTLAAACQTSPSGGRVLPALAAYARRAARGVDPAHHVCRALRRDRRATVATAGRAIATNRALSDLFSQDRRPGLDRLFAAVATSERRGRAGARRLRTLRLQTHAGRELRDELAGLLVRWANAGYVLRDGAPDADAWVLQVGALDAVDRIEEWFSDLSDLRRRTNAVEDRSEALPRGSPASCRPARLLLS